MEKSSVFETAFSKLQMMRGYCKNKRRSRRIKSESIVQEFRVCRSKTNYKHIEFMQQNVSEAPECMDLAIKSEKETIKKN